MSSMRRKDISGRHVLLGALVSLGGSVGSRILGFIALAVLARLLLPADFGIVATAMIFVGLFRALVSRQFHLALVREHELKESHFNTAFTLSFIWGTASGVLLFVSAGILSQWMGEPQIGPILRVMAFLLVLEGLQSPAFARFERDLDLRPDVLCEWIGKSAQYITSISLAFLFQSYWALVIGQLAFTVLRVSLSYIFAPYRPRIDFSHVKEFLSFGGWLSGTGLAGYALAFADITLIALRLGPASVGIYNLAAEIVRMATDYLAMPLARAIYPGLSAVINDKHRFRKAFLNSVQCLLGMMLPIGAGLALVASEVVSLLLGNNWSVAAPVIVILSPAAAFATVSFAAQSVIMAEGRTRAMFARNVVVALLQFPLIWVGIAWAGLEGAAIGRAIGMSIHGLLSLMIAAPIAGLSVGALLLAPWRTYAATAIMVFGTIWFDSVVLSSWGVSPLFLLVSKILFASLFYSAVHLSLWLIAGRPRGFEELLLNRIFRFQKKPRVRTH